VVVRTADGARVAAELREEVHGLRLDAARRRPGPVPPPLAFLVNPTDGAVDVVWDEPGDPRIDGYELAWRRTDTPEWSARRIPPADRHRVAGLANGATIELRLRSRAGERTSEWTGAERAEVGPVAVVDPASAAAEAPIGLLLRTFWYGIVHWATTP
jgi:hypothetical protein